MTTDAWLPIRYRDFYDVPRAFVVEHRGSIYLFDCPFDDNADEYPAHYRVYRLSEHFMSSLDKGTWSDLAKEGTFVREIPVDSVRFDETRRASIDGEILRSF